MTSPRTHAHITRAIVNFFIDLHRRAIYSDLERHQKLVDKKFTEVEIQTSVVAYERGRLSDLREAAADADHEYALAHGKAKEELQQLPEKYL